MSKKKKRHSGPKPAGYAPAQGSKLMDEQNSKEKRLNPHARSLLLFNLVFLAMCQLAYEAGIISDLLSGLATILGIILLVIALWLQFGSGNKSNPSRRKLTK